MPKFKFRAKENTGKTVEGAVEAASQDEAVDKVSDLGYLPIQVEEALDGREAIAAKKAERTVRSSEESAKSGSSGRPAFSVQSKDITSFGRQLSSLIRSGVPILRAIHIIAEPAEHPGFKKFLQYLYDEIKDGKTLSSVLSFYPKLFPPLYTALVQAGEVSGSLDQTLNRITDYRQKQEEIFSRVRSAMIYPALMALVGAGTIIFMLIFVMPRLMGIFNRLGGDLPLVTRSLIAASDFARRGWPACALGTAGALFLLKIGHRSYGQRLMLSRLCLKLPVFGPLQMKAETARFSRTMELLLRSGIPILKAIESAASVVNNELLKAELLRCIPEIKDGSAFGKSLKAGRVFPGSVTSLIAVGEESGKLDEALAEIAVYYERETDEAIRSMTSLLEPLMILVMGLLVGYIVIAMLLPMFEMNMMVH